VRGGHPTAGTAGSNHGARFARSTGTRWLLTNALRQVTRRPGPRRNCGRTCSFWPPIGIGASRSQANQLRCVMLGSLLEIECAVADALAGITPNRLLWGNLTAQEFLTVVDDVTTWSLTHFEPVSAWSGAEDLTAVEEQEGYGIVGRVRRQCGSADQSRNGERSLREVTHPKVRGAALWVAHALLASCHGDASDRSSGIQFGSGASRDLSSSMKLSRAPSSFLCECHHPFVLAH
jgi:hypothetical protein